MLTGWESMERWSKLRRVIVHFLVSQYCPSYCFSGRLCDWRLSHSVQLENMPGGKLHRVLNRIGCLARWYWTRSCWDEGTVRISCSLRGAVPGGLHMTEQKNRFHASVFWKRRMRSTSCFNLIKKLLVIFQCLFVLLFPLIYTRLFNAICHKSPFFELQNLYSTGHTSLIVNIIKLHKISSYLMGYLI